MCTGHIRIHEEGHDDVTFGVGVDRDVQRDEQLVRERELVHLTLMVECLSVWSNQLEHGPTLHDPLCASASGRVFSYFGFLVVK